MADTKGTPSAHRRRSPYSPTIDPEKLKRLRFVHGLMSQDALAKEAGISRAWVAKLENGKGHPSVDTLARLCEALDCTPADLLTDAELKALMAQERLAKRVNAMLDAPAA